MSRLLICLCLLFFAGLACRAEETMFGLRDDLWSSMHEHDQAYKRQKRRDRETKNDNADKYGKPDSRLSDQDSDGGWRNQSATEEATPDTAGAIRRWHCAAAAEPDISKGSSLAGNRFPAEASFGGARERKEFFPADAARSRVLEASLEWLKLISPDYQIGDWVPSSPDRLRNGGFGSNPDNGSPVPYRLNGHIDIERKLPWQPEN